MRSQNAYETIICLVLRCCMFVIHVQNIFKSKKRWVLMEENSLQLDDLNNHVARKRVEYLKKKIVARQNSLSC